MPQRNECFLLSLPVRERGLKLKNFKTWAEDYEVAPRAGAWIETVSYGIWELGFSSLPVRERGLKRCGSYEDGADCRSLPVRERGLKQVD